MSIMLERRGSLYMTSFDQRKSHPSNPLHASSPGYHDLVHGRRMELEALRDARYVSVSSEGVSVPMCEAI